MQTIHRWTARCLQSCEHEVSDKTHKHTLTDRQYAILSLAGSQNLCQTMRVTTTQLPRLHSTALPFHNKIHPLPFNKLVYRLRTQNLRLIAPCQKEGPRSLRPQSGDNSKVTLQVAQGLVFQGGVGGLNKPLFEGWPTGYCDTLKVSKT